MFKEQRKYKKNQEKKYKKIRNTKTNHEKPQTTPYHLQPTNYQLPPTTLVFQVSTSENVSLS